MRFALVMNALVLETNELKMHIQTSAPHTIWCAKSYIYTHIHEDAYNYIHTYIYSIYIYKTVLNDQLVRIQLEG